MATEWYILEGLNLYTLLVEGTRVLLALYVLNVLAYIGNLWRGRESKRASLVILGLIGLFIYLCWAVVHNGVVIFNLEDFMMIAMLNSAIFGLVRGSKILINFEHECNKRNGTCPVCGHLKEV